MKVFITSDHGGYELKNHLVSYLKGKKFDLEDLGPNTLDNQDDYPVYAQKIAEKIQNTPNSLGIVSCKNGVGISIAVNKFDGLRCALSWTPEHAKTSKLDDNANVLSLPADYITMHDAEKIVDVWLSTPYESKERFERRLKEVNKIEEQN